MMFAASDHCSHAMLLRRRALSYFDGGLCG